MGGGGGGNDYSAEQAKQEAKKSTARDALNLKFGIAPTEVRSTAKAPVYTYGREGPGVITEDTSAADQATYASGTDEAAKNKAALDALYGTVRDDAFNAGKTSLDDYKTKATRDNKFALFAQGLNGGSEDIDQNAQLQRTYSQGLIDLGGKADLAKSTLKASDESARLGLLQSIDNGMDQGSALSSAIQQMQNNSEQAKASAIGTDLGDLFASSGLLYTKSNLARGANAGNSVYGGYFGNNGGSTSSRTATGIVSRTN